MGQLKLKRSTLVEQVEELLARDIIEGRFPPGNRLTMADLTERYEASATPMREALQRLAGKGLVEIDPHFGATVAPISRAHLRDTYWMRGVLESEAVRRSVARGDERWETGVREAFARFQAAVAEAELEDPPDVVSWSQAHREFHSAVMAACESPWLVRLLDVVGAHTERYRLLSVGTGRRDPIAEHEEIFRAAVARDGDGAARATQHHLDRTVEVIESTLPIADD
jgi:DNA-binding GntR family transcriptional regulator